MHLFKKSDLSSAEVKDFQPQGVEGVRSETSNAFVKSSMITEKTSFVIDSRVADFIGLTDVKKNEDKKNFDGEVLRYVQKIKDQAFQEAYDKGLLEGENKAREQALEEARQTITEQVNTFSEMATKLKTIAYAENEAEIIAFCYYMAEKIVHQQLEKDPELVKVSIQKILHINESQREQITLKLSQADFDFIEKTGRKVSGLDLSKIKILADENLTPGDVVIDSPQGLIDGRISTRLDKLKSLLESQE
jgi:flagellar assembly protein FliH